MSLKCGIIGIVNAGKSTLFNAVSNAHAETSRAYNAAKSNIAMVNVPDNRLEEIDRFVHAAKVVPTSMEMVDIPGLTKGSGHSESSAGKFLADIRQADALIHVLRCFEDETLPHIEGSIDPVRDKEIVDLELQVRDLESVEKKIHRMDKIAKGGDKPAQRTIEVLKKVKHHLEGFQPVRTLTLHQEEKKHIEDLFLLSEKPVVYVCNVDDKSAQTGNRFSHAFTEQAESEGAEVITIAALLESEIATLEDAADRLVFLEDAGLEEPGVNKLIRAAYHLLDLQTFFTAGPKEVRAWTIRKGMTAQQAAGVIHSDLERGFIRSEVIKYPDFLAFKGSESACRDAGKLAIEGKNYIVQDGDMLHIRFNV